MQSDERTILDMNTWPSLIEVDMRLNDSCGSRRETADLLRWAMGAEPRYGKGYVEYSSPTGGTRPPTAGKAANRHRFLRRVGLKAHATLRLWAYHLHQRCRALGLRSWIPPTHQR